MVQQQLNAAIIHAKELSDKVTGEGDPQYIQELKNHVLELTQKRIEDEDTLLSVQQELKTAKEEIHLLQEQLYQWKNGGNGNNESVLKDQLMALAKEFNSYKMSSQKIIAELHLRVSSSSSSTSSKHSSVNTEQITSQQLQQQQQQQQQQQRGLNMDTSYSTSELASESNDSNATPKRSRFILPPSDPSSKG